MAKARMSLTNQLQQQYLSQQNQMANQLYQLQSLQARQQQAAGQAASKSATDSYRQMPKVEQVAVQANNMFGGRAGDAMALLQHTAGHAMTRDKQAFINNVLGDAKYWAGGPKGLSEQMLVAVAASYFDAIK
jgi:flagellum-specific peptidoglycan hydrolase FlgJ